MNEIKDEDHEAYGAMVYRQLAEARVKKEEAVEIEPVKTNKVWNFFKRLFGR